MIVYVIEHWSEADGLWIPTGNFRRDQEKAETLCKFLDKEYPREQARRVRKYCRVGQ